MNVLQLYIPAIWLERTVYTVRRYVICTSYMLSTVPSQTPSPSPGRGCLGTRLVAVMADR